MKPAAQSRFQRRRSSRWERENGAAGRPDSSGSLPSGAAVLVMEASRLDVRQDGLLPWLTLRAARYPAAGPSRRAREGSGWE